MFQVDKRVQELSEAYLSGWLAQREGKMRVPALDPDFIKWACSQETATVDLLKAWLAGWDGANLDA